jgi:hypothetical protein
MTHVATIIVDRCADSVEVIEMSEEFAIDIDQDWDDGSTTFTFSDNSEVVVSGPEFYAFFEGCVL